MPEVFKGQNADLHVQCSGKFSENILSREKHKNMRMFNSLRTFKVRKTVGYINENFLKLVRHKTFEKKL